VESFKTAFSKYYEQFSAYWNALSQVQRISIISGFVLLVALIAVTVTMSTRKDYEYLFVNLSSEDTLAITDYLKRSNFSDYIIDNKGLRVPNAQVAHFRLKLSQEGLPSQGHVGWEKFDESNFTRTEFERQIQKMRAIQGELARTISQIQGISHARVHIVTPKARLFETDQKDPTAAIYIKTDRSTSLSNTQIRGIVHLVSKSVEGMKPENISVIDFEGNLLTSEMSRDPDAQETKELIENKHKMERQLEQKIKAIVGRVVGQERVDAKVDLDMDFTKEEKTISDIDPEKVVVISQNTTSQKATGSGLNPTGIPGSKSNVPGEQEATNLVTSGSENSRDTELVNYEVAKTISHRVLPSGSVKRISAAVIVDGKQVLVTEGTSVPFEPRTPEEMQKIEDLVKSAIGFVASRDEVKVHNMMFEPDFTQVQTRTIEIQEQREYVSLLSLVAASSLAIVLFFLFVVRPYIRWLMYDPTAKASQNVLEEYKPNLEMSGPQTVQTKEDVPFDKLSPREQVMYLAKHEPERTTEALRMLLNPHQ
jgi:flagellar M-ring protein FliF